jgi:pectin methylesterase-like acyl-CoA thioesterase
VRWSRTAGPAVQVVSSVGAVAVTSAALLASAGGASASTRPQLWVATTGTATAADTSCATTRYSTAQSAVTAAENRETAHPLVVPRIELCPGTYQERVTITKRLAITHAPEVAGS